MTPAKTGTLPNLPSISNQNKTCKMRSSNVGPDLISLGKLFDDNYLTVCDKGKCAVYEDDKPTLKARR